MTTEHVPERLEPSPTLQEVAARRGWQTLFTGLAIDVAVAVAFVIGAEVGRIQTMEEFLAPALILAVTKSAVQAAAAWVVRRWMDQSGYNPDGSPKTG